MATGKSITGSTVNVGDQVTLVGRVASITGAGGQAVVVVSLVNSGNQVSAQANDMYCASSSTT